MKQLLLGIALALLSTSPAGAMEQHPPVEPELRDLHNAAFRLVEETEPKVIVEGAHVPEAVTGANLETKA